MTDPGLPLTTGEGLRDDGLTDQEGVVMDALVAADVLGECGRLREQLDAARQTLAELDAELDRYDGLWQDETRKVDPNYARIVQIEAHQNGLRWARERFARAALGVEGPAG